MGKRLTRSARGKRARSRALPAVGALVLFVAVAAGIIIQAHGSRGTRVDWAAAIARGRQDFATGSCISCHALYPISSAGGAIDLTHEGNRHTFTWLQHEIRFPTSQRPPTPPGQADDLAAFLSSLH